MLDYGNSRFQDFNDIPDSEKNGLYYFVTTTFVISTLLSTLFSAAFLVISVLLWGNFKTVIKNMVLEYK
ncbi:unnamed protein product [Caenorhabditis nigoni]